MNKNKNQTKTKKEIGIIFGTRIKIGIKLPFLFFFSGFLHMIKKLKIISKIFKLMTRLRIDN